MRGHCVLWLVGALMLTAMPAAQAQTGERPATAKSIKAKKKPAHAAAHAPRPQPAGNAGEMTPGTGPALLRGIKDDNM